jgi:hypothetical protein
MYYIIYILHVQKLFLFKSSIEILFHGGHNQVRWTECLVNVFEQNSCVYEICVKHVNTPSR